MSLYNWLSAQLSCLIFGAIPICLLFSLAENQTPLIYQNIYVKSIGLFIVCLFLFICFKVFKFCFDIKQPTNLRDSLKISIIAPFYKVTKD